MGDVYEEDTGRFGYPRAIPETSAVTTRTAGTLDEDGDGRWAATVTLGKGLFPTLSCLSTPWQHRLSALALVVPAWWGTTSVPEVRLLLLLLRQRWRLLSQTHLTIACARTPTCLFAGLLRTAA